MDAVVVATLALATVALVALGVVAFAIATLARSAHERRIDLLRGVLAERAAEVSTSAEALRPAAEILEPEEPDAGAAAAHPEPEPLPTQQTGYAARHLREQMIEAHLDPDDGDDLRVFQAMKEAGLDPTNAEHVHYWNEADST